MQIIMKKAGELPVYMEEIKMKKGTKITLGVLAGVFIIGAIGSSGSDSGIPTVSPVPSAVVEEVENNEVSEKEVDTTPSTTPSTKPIETPKTEPVKYKSGSYKVGNDIPAGEYVLFNDGFMAYYSVCKDSTGELDSIISNDNFNENTIITIKDGQYFEISDAYAINIKDVKELDTSKEGMFKVGKHIKAGEYKLEVNESSILGMGYVEVSKDSTHDLNSIISNDNFEGTKYITVKDGQYLKLSDCKIVK